MTKPVATTSTSTKILESAARLSRVITSDSEFDTGSELFDLDFLSAGEYEASASVPATASGSVGLGAQPLMYTSTVNGSGMHGRGGEIRGLGIEDGNVGVVGQAFQWNELAVVRLSFSSYLSTFISNDPRNCNSFINNIHA